MKTSRIKTDAIAVPADRAGAEKLLAEIGRLQRQHARIEADMNDRLAAVKEEHEAHASQVNEEIEQKFIALHTWAEGNKKTLLKGKAKSARLATGILSWRMTPPAVRISKAKDVIDRLHAKGLGFLIRLKEEINKDAILADPEQVKGVKGITITQREEFAIKPFESQIERAEPVRKTK